MTSNTWAYGNAIRWGSIDEAMQFIAPEYLKEHPVSRLELERFKHVKFSRYMERSTELSPDGQTMLQNVEISVINIHTQHERSFVDHQTWKWNEQLKRWQLWSGLPDITRKNNE